MQTDSGLRRKFGDSHRKNFIAKHVDGRRSSNLVYIEITNSHFMHERYMRDCSLCVLGCKNRKINPSEKVKCTFCFFTEVHLRRIGKDFRY